MQLVNKYCYHGNNKKKNKIIELPFFLLLFSVLTGDEDLTHLAPQAGDLCVSLDENPVEYVLPDVLDEVMLSDCKLLPNDNIDRNFSSPSSAFFNYRDGLEPSSRPLSPILTQVCTSVFFYLKHIFIRCKKMFLLNGLRI